MIRTSSSVLAIVLASTSAHSQVAQVPVDPGAPVRELPGNAVNPLVTYQMGRFKASRGQAEERVAIQGDILQVLENPAFRDDPAFAGIAVQNEPVYRIYLTYFDNDSKAELLKLIPPRMRQYLKIRKAKFDKMGRQGALAQLNAALGSAGVEYVAFFRETDEKFHVHTPSPANVARLQSLVPQALAADVEILQRELPREQQTSGQKSFYVLAGHMLNPGCTLGFPITYTYAGVAGRKGILTAGHCADDGVRTINWNDGTKTSFDRAIWSINTGNYDYAIYDLTGINTDYRIFYRNNVTYGGYTNVVPQFPASGTLNTKNFIRGSSSWEGMNVCKHGTFTGLTCGQISSLSYPWRGVNSGTSFIYVDQSQQQNLSTSGDSGGPWFTWTNPSTSVDVSALGVHVAGSGAGYGGSGIYMPIERLFDAQSGGPSNIKLVTTPY